jgi:hypothetical protein
MLCSAIDQPSNDSDWITAAAIGFAACHTSAGNGCHAANSRLSVRLVHNK